jgi:thiamine kinase-like enzyme
MPSPIIQPVPASLLPFLAREIFPKLGLRETNLRFLMKPLSASHRVFCCQEKHSRLRVIAKFAGAHDPRLPQGASSLVGEFENLVFLRRLGFDRPPYRVARPLGKEERIGLTLVVASEPGKNLDYFFKKAIWENQSEALGRRLRQLASFLAHLHQKTIGLQFRTHQPAEQYLAKVFYQLGRKGLLRDLENGFFEETIKDWRNRFREIADRPVLIHGDATPTNFLFSSEEEIVAIDLERMRMADRLWDVGMVCGEIKHAFLWRLRDYQGSEPFIHDFISSYASHFPKPEASFRRLCLLNPYYMALTELRIARNDYLDLPYRKLLIEEARACLQNGLSLT